jgi:DNA primase
MENEKDILLEILRSILGKEKNYYNLKHQITFDCPVCSYEIKELEQGDGKGNLEINTEKLIYKCWSCCDSHGTHGPVGKLIDLWGNKKQKKIFDLIKPKDDEVIKSIIQKIRLPDGYIKFKDSNPILIQHKEAYNYLKKRGVTDLIIDKFDIGYTVEGDFKNRIIIPSYDCNNNLNYFIARSWVKTKMKYKNPTIPKDTIIFNESRIDFNKDIYLLEGAFDSIFVDNSIPLLGKHISPLLFEKLYNDAKKNIIIALDGDAFNNAQNLFHELNGGILFGRIKILKLPKDKDVADLKGQIDEFEIFIK